MAGHSHSKNVRLRKGAVDAKRSKLFTKMSKLIMVAVKAGGPDPAMNAKLSFALSKAKAVSLPKDTIEKAIKKGSGELDDGEHFEELLYEGYGPNGVAVICEILTDKRNRTASEVRKIFEQSGGNLGATNCVSWMFQRKGKILISSEGKNEEELFEKCIEAGAEDLINDDDYFVVYTNMETLNDVVKSLEDAGIEIEEADLAFVADTMVDLSVDDGVKVLKLLDDLDNQDDVQNVHSNAQIPKEAYETV